MALAHPSYPGHYGLSLSPEASATLGVVADAIIPAADGFPSATDAGVVAFVSDHMTPDEHRTLEALLGGIELGAEPAGALRELERARPGDFVVLVTWVYQAYWCSHAALAALRRSGSDYHGAPQPFGYELPPFELVPATLRGSYVPTAEVRRAER